MFYFILYYWVYAVHKPLAESIVHQNLLAEFAQFSFHPSLIKEYFDDNEYLGSFSL